MRRRPTPDRGETLIELLVSIGILGIAGVAIIGGLALAVEASDMHRKETTGGAYVRNYAEALRNYVASTNSHYVACAPLGSYAPAVLGWSQLSPNAHWVDSAGAEVIPAGYTPSVTQVNSVSATGVVGPCTSDTGVQSVALQVASSDGRAVEKLTVLIRKPCPGTGANPCS